MWLSGQTSCSTAIPQDAPRGTPAPPQDAPRTHPARPPKHGPPSMGPQARPPQARPPPARPRTRPAKQQSVALQDGVGADVLCPRHWSMAAQAESPPRRHLKGLLVRGRAHIPGRQVGGGEVGRWGGPMTTGHVEHLERLGAESAGPTSPPTASRCATRRQRCEPQLTLGGSRSPACTLLPAVGGPAPRWSLP